MSYYLKKHWKLISLALVLVTVTMSVSSSLSLLVARSFQGVLDGNMRSFLIWLFADMAGWFLFLFLDSLYYRVRSWAIRELSNSVRRDLAATLLQKDYVAYHSQDKGAYLSWFTTGVDKIQEAWETIFNIAYYAASAVSSLVILLSYHWFYLPLALLSAVLMTVTPKLFEKRIERLSKATAQGQERGISKLKDMLGGFDVLRFFGRCARFQSGVDQASELIEKPACEERCKSRWYDNAMGSINIASQTINLAAGGIMALWGLIPISFYMFSGNLLGNLSNGLIQFATCRLELVALKPYFQRITVHADELDREAPQGPEPVREAIHVEDVSFRYGEKPVLDNLTATFEKGKKYAITGPSGCGKSALLKLILGWLPGYQGNIRFDGKSAKDYTPEQLQQQMSYIAQDVFLFNTTIRDNITLGGEFTREQMEKALRDSALAGDLAEMPQGLDTPVGEEGGSLSGGQRQRVAIARALIHNRSILLVDEGTSALDQKNASIVEESLLANPDLTLILVSHHLTEERKAQFDNVYCLDAAAVQAQ